MQDHDQEPRLGSNSSTSCRMAKIRRRQRHDPSFEQMLPIFIGAIIGSNLFMLHIFVIGALSAQGAPGVIPSDHIAFNMFRSRAKIVRLEYDAVFALAFAELSGSECFRLAALVYSLLVTSLLPRSVAPFQRLVPRLKVALTWWDGGDEMLVLVLAMGGIGAPGLGDRKWFVNEFRTAVTRIGVGSWDEAKEMIRLGLWFGATNDRDRNDFWLETQSLEIEET
ncbi:hypothetical protein B7494_g1993 [Chlorociboria aeruginascens]|nr:hypothetical protein B7494_g1993 [Chlorociboria aeruginascens]